MKAAKLSYEIAILLGHMKLSDFDYNLPEELIAQAPNEPRDHSRLLVLDQKGGKVSHHTFYEVLDYLKAGDVLVVNNSKVFPARLFGKRSDTGGKVEILLNKNISPVISKILEGLGPDPGIQDSKSSVWEAIGKNLKPGTKIEFKNSNISPLPSPRRSGMPEGVRGSKIVSSLLKATVLEKKGKISTIQFNLSGDNFFSEIEKIGHTPLPPYIKKADTKKDKIYYQTVYAKLIGSAAAPTAGLHFTKILLDQIRKKGIEIAEVTLHVGLGTFAPVESENIEAHPIHSEYYTVIPTEIEKIIKAKKEGRRIIAVGTTSTRVLETIFNAVYHPRLDRGSKIVDLLVDSRTHSGIPDLHGNDGGYAGWTKIFIYPGYQFKCIDGLITNFHLPKSSLLMLVSALAGKENIDRAYQEAIKQEYRFFSYGDAMLII